MPVQATAPSAPIVQMGLFDTITESIFGQPDPNTWRPLPLSTFFSEGWNEAWVPSPNGSGGAPRQGWINAMDGNLYRLWFFTFAQAFNNAPKGNAYLGSYTLLTPLSRRLELIINVPFVHPEQCRHRLAHPGPEQSEWRRRRRRATSGFGDISFTPRFLLHETKDFSLTAEMAVRDPDRHPAPRGENNHPGPGLRLLEQLRGRLGDPGRARSRDPDERQWGQPDQPARHRSDTFTDHDVPLFGDFTCYLSAVVNTSLANGELDQRDADPRHANPPGKRLVFPGRSTNARDQRASRRHRHDLLVHESVVSRGGTWRKPPSPGGNSRPPGLFMLAASPGDGDNQKHA